MPTPSTSPRPSVDHRASLAVVLGTLLAVLDLGLINISLPTLAIGLNVEESQAVWISTIYQLVCAATLMVASALSYTLGKKRVYLTGLLLFILGLAGSALAANFTVLMIFRVVQGLGASALLALGPAMLRTIYPPSRLGKALALNALVVASGLAVGPSLGGVVLFFADWRWIFAINLPLGVIAAWLTFVAVSTEPYHRNRFDWQGALYSAIVMSTLMLAMERIGHGSSALLPAIFATTSLIFGVLFIARQRRAPQPLLPLEIFRKSRFTLSIISTLLAFIAQGLAFVALSFLYQSVFNFSPLKAALLFAPWPVSLIFSGPFSGWLSDRTNPALLSSLGMLGFLSGLAVLAWGSHEQSLIILVIGSFWCGLGYGFFQVPNNHEIMANAPMALSSTASGVLATVRTLGQSIGSAVFALVWSLQVGRIDLALWVACVAAFIALFTSSARLIRWRAL